MVVHMFLQRKIIETFDFMWRMRCMRYCLSTQCNNLSRTNILACLYLKKKDPMAHEMLNRNDSNSEKLVFLAGQNAKILG